MAIEFQCPYCSAVLRVPDTAGGKTGSCPGCRKKVLVPVPERPPVEEGAEFSYEALDSDDDSDELDDDEFEITTRVPKMPPLGTPVAPESDAHSGSSGGAVPIPDNPFPNWGAQQPSAETPAAVPTPPSPEPGIPVAPPAAVPGPVAADVGPPEAGVPVFGNVAPPASMAGRIRRRSRRSKSALIVPGILVLCLIGGIVYYVWPERSVDQLLRAKPVNAIELCFGEVDRDDIDTSENAYEFLVNDLSVAPQMLKSPGVMDTEIRASEGGLQFRLFLDPKAEMFELDPSKHRGLSEFLEDKAVKMDRARREKLDTMAAEFVAEWYTARRDNPRGRVKDFTTYRNQLVLNTMRGGLGYHVVAVVGKKAFECVLENDGKLYFILPKGTESFVLQTRPKIESGISLPGKYTVEVVETKSSKTGATDEDSNGDEPDTDSDADEDSDAAD